MQLVRFAPLWVVAFVLVPTRAAGYEIKTSSSGAPVHWARAEVVFVPALTPGPPAVANADAVLALGASAAAWRDAVVSGVVGVAAADTTAPAATHINDGVNTVRWALGKSDPDIERGVLALTFVAYRASDGVIEDADVVLNAADFAWMTSTAGCVSQYDLASALTHELGHALGLAHSEGHPEATMYATGLACEVIKRDLDSDDLAGIAALYPPPAVEEAGGGCSAGRGRGGGLAAVLAAALIAGRVRAGRRRAKRQVRSLLVLGLLCVAAPASGAQLRRLALEDLGQEAVMVVRGHVVAAAVVTGAEGAPIESESEIVVEECLSGDCPARVRVVRRGGERDGLGLWVDGEAVPVVGAEVVLYLRRDVRARLRVLGGLQGMLRVVTTPQGRFAVRDLRRHQVRVDGDWQAGTLELVRLDGLVRSLAR